MKQVVVLVSYSSIFKVNTEKIASQPTIFLGLLQETNIILRFNNYRISAKSDLFKIHFESLSLSGLISQK